MTTPDGRENKGTPSLQELVAAKKAELEAQLRILNTLDIETLLREREETAVRLAELDGRIAQVRAQLGENSGAVRERATSRTGTHPPAGDPTRPRMSSEEVNRRIMRVLAEGRDGLSQLQIAEQAALAYGTVAAYLKTNFGRFRVTGHLKGKRYFLK